MQQLQTIHQTIEDVGVTVNLLKQEIKEAVRNLPDNPNIKRLGKGFTMNASQIFGNPNNPHSRMDVFYHDHKAQYELVAEVIEKTRAESILDVIQKLVETEKYRVRNHIYHFSPEVVGHIKYLLEL